MTKKVIIFVLIILLFINTIFWLYIGIRVYRLISLEKFWRGGTEAIAKTKHDVNELFQFYQIYAEKRQKITTGLGGTMIATFEDTYPHAPFIILAITDAVLIAISFMIIFLYKRD